MELYEFTQKVCRAMTKEFGEEYRVEVKEIQKNNGVMLHGLLISSQEHNVAPTIYLEPFWEAYEEGVTFADVIRELKRIYREETRKESINMEFFRDFEKVKDRICYRLIGRKENRELLQKIPHMDFLDLTICFFYAYRGEELGEGSILIYHSHMQLWQTDIQELIRLAEVNTPRLFPWKLFSMEEVLQEFFREQAIQAPDAEALREITERVPMKVLSNRQKSYGAASILYGKVLEGLAEKFGKSFFILPSSIHEVILLPDNGEDTPAELKNMVQEVNRTQVAPEEVLSESVYYFDRRDWRVKKIF